MVGFLYSPTTEVGLGEEEEEINEPSQLKKSNDPIDLSLPELDDFSVAFADSFLDFDSLRDWIEENPDPYTMADMKPDPDTVDSEKVESGVVERRIDMGKDGSCMENVVVDPVEDVSGKLESLGCLIEEEMGKVSLEGVSYGSAVVYESETKNNGGGLNGNEEKSCEIVTGNCDGSKIVGVESGEVAVSAGGNEVKSGDIVGKSGEIVSDGVENDNDSESEGESSSSSSSSSSDDDDDDDVGDKEKEEEDEESEKKEKREAEMDMEEGEIRDSDVEKTVEWSDDEDDGGGNVVTGPIRSKNEFKILPPVPPVNVTLQPYHQTLPVGVVLSVIGAQVIVEGVEKHNPLNEGSILWVTESRSPLGLVDEIFGPVKNPYYVVRYNSEGEVPAGILQGTLISFVPEFVNHVLNNNNLYKKGYDASGENDEEVSDELEFSDDEKEAEYRRMLKMSKRGTNDQKVGKRKKDKRKLKGRSGNWQNDKFSATQALASPSLPLDQNQHCVPLVTASLDSRPSGPEQGLTGGPSLVPQFPQLAQTPGFIPAPNGAWRDGITCQQPQNMVFSIGFPSNGMQWLQQNPPPQPHQMTLHNGMLFHQQFGSSQIFPSNFVLPGAHATFGAGPAYASWPACFGQSSANQSPFGMQAPPPMHVAEQGLMPSGPQMERNSDLPPRSFASGNTETSRNFNRGVNFVRGKKPYRRGGGRFGGGRGRQQS